MGCIVSQHTPPDGLSSPHPLYKTLQLAISDPLRSTRKTQCTPFGTGVRVSGWEYCFGCPFFLVFSSFFPVKVISTPLFCVRWLVAISGGFEAQRIDSSKYLWHSNYFRFGKLRQYGWIEHGAIGDHGGVALAIDHLFVASYQLV